MASRRNLTQLKVTEAGYIPVDDDGFKQHAKFKPGALVGAEIARNRSLPQHKMYWAVLTKVVEHAPGEWRTPEALHEVLKVATGRVETVKLLDGRLVKIPQSTSFAEMGQDAFNEYSAAAFQVICDEILDGMSVDEFMSYTDRPETNAAARIISQGNWG